MNMENESKADEALVTLTFRIEGMGCFCESKILEKRVRSFPGVKSFSLNAISNQMKVTCDPAAVSVEDLQKSVSRAGMKAVLLKSV